MKQVKIEKRSVEERLTDLWVEVMALDRECNELEEMLKAHAGWLSRLEGRIRKLEPEEQDG